MGMLRVVVPDYSPAAFREALANALIHRDYTRLGTVHVQWHADRLEISNPGGFPEGVRLDNLLVTAPRPRNPLLADAFKRAGIVEPPARGKGQPGVCPAAGGGIPCRARPWVGRATHPQRSLAGPTSDHGSSRPPDPKTGTPRLRHSEPPGRSGTCRVSRRTQGAHLAFFGGHLPPTGRTGRLRFASVASNRSNRNKWCCST